jgi:catechol 2,3-dioxygenase-like lactoylglutathione lyase family enzyme
MSLRIECITIDSSDPQAAAAWWAEALGYHIDEEMNEDDDVGIKGDGPTMLFQRVPEGKTVKNRIHLDLRPDDRDAQVARLEAMGATRVDIGQTGEDSWIVLADPEGNELCVLRGSA